MFRITFYSCIWKKKKKEKKIYKPRYAMFYSPTGEWERKQEEGKKIHGFQHCSCYCRLIMYTHTKQQSRLCYRNIKKQLWNIQKCFKKYVYWYIHMYTNWPITAKTNAQTIHVSVLPRRFSPQTDVRIWSAKCFSCLFFFFF